jgi:hypothetical protein
MVKFESERSTRSIFHYFVLGLELLALPIF